MTISDLTSSDISCAIQDYDGTHEGLTDGCHTCEHLNSILRDSEIFRKECQEMASAVVSEFMNKGVQGLIDGVYMALGYGLDIGIRSVILKEGKIVVQ